MSGAQRALAKARSFGGVDQTVVSQRSNEPTDTARWCDKSDKSDKRVVASTPEVVFDCAADLGFLEVGIGDVIVGPGVDAWIEWLVAHQGDPLIDKAENFLKKIAAVRGRAP